MPGLPTVPGDANDPPNHRSCSVSWLALFRRFPDRAGVPGGLVMRVARGGVRADMYHRGPWYDPRRAKGEAANR